MFNLIEGDGLIENIYHLLWTKDSIFGIDPYVVVPHTILYKYSKPCYWYFTSKVDSKLKKKSSSSLTSEHIKQEFLKGYDPNIGIVAYFIYKKFKPSTNNKYSGSLNKLNIENNEKPSNQEKDEGLIIEYLTKQRFIECVDKKMPYEDGLLQKFEAPKGEHNFIIRLIWSPKMCLFEKKVNLKKIHDSRYDIYERVVTFDGEEFQTETQPMRGTNLPDRIEKIANSIVNHISSISLEMIKIVRMILNFRITENDNIKLLWCSSLRLDKSTSSSISDNALHGLKFKEYDVEKISLSVPENINLFQYSVKGKALKTQKNSTCPNCDKRYENEKLFEVKFKTLVEAHDSRKRDKEFFGAIMNSKYTSSGMEIIPYLENKNDFDVKESVTNYKIKNLLIPKVIMEMFPKLKYEQYAKMKKDEVFLSKSAKICSKCFMATTKYCNIAGTNTENLIRTLRNQSLPQINQKSNMMRSQINFGKKLN